VGEEPVLALASRRWARAWASRVARGGGASTVQPAERINLHFTATSTLTTANNLWPR
jgi:hypothetical protein